MTSIKIYWHLSSVHLIEGCREKNNRLEISPYNIKANKSYFNDAKMFTTIFLLNQIY